jgi:putative ABC transport system substrate-binding protein
MLKEIKPDLSHLAVLAQLQIAVEASYLREIEGVCNALSLSVRPFDARSFDALRGAFAAMTEWQANGLITLNDAFFFSQRDRIIKLALNNKLAAVHPEREFVEAGGLLSYGPNLRDLFRRAASYVDKILKRDKTERNTNRAADKIRAGSQSPSREGARADDLGVLPGAR